MATATKKTAKSDLRHEQVQLDGKPRVDRENGIIRRVKVLGIKSKHGYSYAIPAQQKAFSRFEQMPVGLDHAYDGSPLKIEQAWGTLSSPTVDEQGTWADLSYLKSHPLTEQILEDLERGTGLFSLSAVNQVRKEQNKVVEDFVPVRVDLVVRGATTRTLLEQDLPELQGQPSPDSALLVQVLQILEKDLDLGQKQDAITAVFAAHLAMEPTEPPPVEVVQPAEGEGDKPAEGNGETPPPAEEKGETEELKEQFAALQAKYDALEKRVVLYEQHVNPTPALQQQIADTTAGFDLKKFWNDGK